MHGRKAKTHQSALFLQGCSRDSRDLATGNFLFYYSGTKKALAAVEPRLSPGRADKLAAFLFFHPLFLQISTLAYLKRKKFCKKVYSHVLTTARVQRGRWSSRPSTLTTVAPAGPTTTDRHLGQAGSQTLGREMTTGSARRCSHRLRLYTATDRRHCEEKQNC